ATSCEERALDPRQLRPLKLQHVAGAERHRRCVGAWFEIAFHHFQRCGDARFRSQGIAFTRAQAERNLLTGIVPDLAIDIRLVACALLVGRTFHPPADLRLDERLYRLEPEQPAYGAGHVHLLDLLVGGAEKDLDVWDAGRVERG